MEWISVEKELPKNDGHVFAALLCPGTKLPFQIQWYGVTWNNNTGWKFDPSIVEDKHQSWKVVYWTLPVSIECEKDKRTIAWGFVNTIKADGLLNLRELTK